MLSIQILLTIIVILLSLIIAFWISSFLSKKKSSPDANKYNPNIAAVVRDVLIRSMSGGQFPLALIALVIIIGIVVMGGNNVYKLFHEVIDLFKSLYVFGWLLSVLTIFLSSLAIWRIRISFRNQRTIISEENIVLKERINTLQEQNRLLTEQVANRKTHKK